MNLIYEALSNPSYKGNEFVMYYRFSDTLAKCEGIDVRMNRLVLKLVVFLAYAPF